MSSSYVKGRLKASREAIQAKDWDSAIETATQALEEEGDNYNAHVFKGLALLNKGKLDEAEASYRTAIQLQPKQLLAYQGLDKLYTENEKWDKLATLVAEQMDLAVEADEATKLAELQQRLVGLRREYGTQTQVAEALSNYLVGSAYYDLLSTLPVPDQTSPEATTTFSAQMAVHVESLNILLEIITIHEQNEKTTIDREVEKRKTRLDSAGKSREQLRNEIGIEVWEQSALPGLYEQVLSHSNASDEVRRDAEHKMFLYRLQLLKALPNPKARLAAPSGNAATTAKQQEDDTRAQERKEQASARVQELAEGIVTINVADDLAWTHVLETTDVFYMSDLNFSRLRAFVSHFSRLGLAASLRALLLLMQDAQYLKEQKELEEKADVEVAPSDPFVLALNGLEQAPESILAHRIASVLYLRDRDWLSCSEVATAGLTLVRRAEVSLCIDLRETKASLEAALALSLIYLHPPQHHTRALRLCDSALASKPSDSDMLLGKALIHQAAGRWEQAHSILDSLAKMGSPEATSSTAAGARLLAFFDNAVREARLEKAWCDVHLNRLTEAEVDLRAVLDELDQDASVHPSEHARAWWRLGYCQWQRGGEYCTDRGQAFTCFITALKKDAVFAPAFTSLGFYYQDAASPPDHQRASKCFQKAFELDASQNAAAQRLAEIYANEDDWDLVDLVARRSVEAEGGSWILKSGNNANVRRHTTENVWAWSAIGSTELVRGNPERAIVAFQVALRSHASQAHLWMRLGEAYVASQRFSAAIKAFERAHSLQGSKEQWQAAYCIASVQSQLGMYDEAIAAFEQLVKGRPEDVQLLSICAMTRLARARRDASEGYDFRAARAVMHAIAEARVVLIQDDQIDAAWKVAADGLLFLASHASSLEQTSFVELCLQPLLSRVQALGVDGKMNAITAVTHKLVKEQDATTNAGMYCTLFGALLCKVRVYLFADREMLSGSVWMDLAVALDALKMQSQLDASADASEHAQDCHRQAIACVKEALKVEPGNEVFWTSLGNLVFEPGVPLAQHCYIKAIDCNAKSAIPWTNLGLLYLANDDCDLAGEAFLRAQTLEPDYAPLWVGHALVARARGDHDSVQSMFHNAYSLAPGSVLEAAYGFAAATLKSSKTSAATAQLQDASYALVAFLAKRPDDAAALHLSALLAESLGHSDLAVARIDHASSIIEAQYEKEESSQVAQRFAICMVNLGRVQLARQDYDRAQEVFEMSLGLLDTAESTEGDATATTADVGERIRLGAHCGIGLAHAARNDWASAQASLQEALDETNELTAASQDEIRQLRYTRARQTLSALLAQVSFASGDAVAADERLLAEVTADSRALQAMTLLGALSAFRGDVEQLDILASDMQGLLAGKMCKDEPTVNAALSFLCHSLMHQGKVSEARDLLKGTDAITPSQQLLLLQLLLQQAAESTDAAPQADLARQAETVAMRLASILTGRLASTNADVLLSKALGMGALASVFNSHHSGQKPDAEMRLDSATDEHLSKRRSSVKRAAQSLLVAPQTREAWTTMTQILALSA